MGKFTRNRLIQKSWHYSTRDEGGNYSITDQCSHHLELANCQNRSDCNCTRTHNHLVRKQTLSKGVP